MKVVHLSTSDTNGGAAIAALRIFNAQVKSGIDSKLLVQSKHSNDPRVISLVLTFWDKLKYYQRFLEDELSIRTLSVYSRGRFTFPYFGLDLSKNIMINEADIINLHWTNGGFLSLKSLLNIGKMSKPIVWTLHDMWSFTGGCHYNSDCNKFVEQCNNCPSLKFRNEFDQSQKIFKRKEALYKKLNLTIVTCSNWLAKEAGRSKLFENKQIVTISNPIDTNVYKPNNKENARKKFEFEPEKLLLLIGAMNLKEKRKGFSYLVEALQYIYENYKEFGQKIELLTFGKLDRNLEGKIPFKIHQLGQIENENQLIALYNSANLYIAPSLQDNLPNTVLESISCGTPVVAFKVGGMTDMITHNENGYLVELKSSKDLADGIVKLLSDSELLKEMGNNCRQKAINQFGKSKVANQYLNLYQKLLLK